MNEEQRGEAAVTKFCEAKVTNEEKRGTTL